MEKEIWRPIKGYKNYQVSNQGNIKNIKKNKLIKPYQCSDGHCQVRLYKTPTENKQLLVHRLVYEAFYGKIPFWMVINHKDENPANNQLSNLMVCTVKENNCWGTGNIRRSQTLKNNEKESTPVGQYDLNGNLIRIWESQNEVERQLNIKQQDISRCCNNIKYRKTAGGYIWKFV